MTRPHVVAVIPARGRSKGLARKNIRLLAGKPLLAYTIEAAKACADVDRVIVSTDDDEIAEVARRYGAETPFRRPVELADDHSPTEPVLQHAVEWLEREEGYRVDIVLFLQPTDIFRSQAVVDETVRRLLADETLDSAFAAVPTHKNFWRKVGERYVRLAPDIGYGPRQLREPLFREDTGVACASRAAVIRQGRRIGDRVSLVISQDEHPFVDIHTEFDLWLAETIMAETARPHATKGT